LPPLVSPWVPGKAVVNNAWKGVLLSGLVFPGLGQVVQKHYKRGIVLMVTTFFAMAVVVALAVRQALSILEKMESDGGPIDINTISNAAAQATSPSGSLILRLLLATLAMGWIYGMVDAYRMGRKKDLE
jgi:hypothetical protein